MWSKGWREKVWGDLNQEWDILIIGGGITGAGVFRRAVEEGYKTLLVEARDFASGISSTSSKLIHGGIRYLRNKQFGVSRECVREREWMVREADKLVTPLGFIMPYPPGLKYSFLFSIGVVIYDLLAPKWDHAYLSRRKMFRICPFLNQEYYKKGALYYDAGMDDSRIVTRMIRETVRHGGVALNYARVTQLLRTSKNQVCGAVLQDQAEDSLGDTEIKARVVINATGPWSDEVRNQIGAPARLRKLRGSHLVFSHERLPLPHAVSIVHPRDHRAMFAIPWEGVSIIGTTDLDHQFQLSQGDAFATSQEIEYILEAANVTFAPAGLGYGDIVSTFSGLRPVINTGIADPDKESRAHAIWNEDGMITVTGGKFTTFRIMAEQALSKAMPYLPCQSDLSIRKRYFDPLPSLESKVNAQSVNLPYLLGRHGEETDALLDSALPTENEPIFPLPCTWSEIRWAARDEGVIHLDDLLLRRVRLGILLPDGASCVMERVRSIAQPELGWNDTRWEEEETRYRHIYQTTYSADPAGFPES